MNTKLVDIVMVSFFLIQNIFASCSTVSYVKFKLVNVATTILFLWIQEKLFVKGQLTNVRAKPFYVHENQCTQKYFEPCTASKFYEGTYRVRK